MKTRLVPPLSLREAARLSAAFLGDLIDRLSRLPVDVIVALPPEADPSRMSREFPAVSRWVSQGPGDLGERLQRVIGWEFSSGASSVLVVGADHPNLPLDFLRCCLEATSRGGTAWITTEDGGYAALGLARPLRRIFEEIPWSTARVAAVTLERALEQEVVIEHAGTWYDVDRVEDLQRLAGDLERDECGCTRSRALLRRWRPVLEKRGILPPQAPDERSAP